MDPTAEGTGDLLEQGGWALDHGGTKEITTKACVALLKGADPPEALLPEGPGTIIGKGRDDGVTAGKGLPDAAVKIPCEVMAFLRGGLGDQFHLGEGALLQLMLGEVNPALMKVVGEIRQNGKEGDAFAQFRAVLAGLTGGNAKDDEAEGDDHANPLVGVLAKLGHVPVAALGKIELEAVDQLRKLGIGNTNGGGAIHDGLEIPVSRPPGEEFQRCLLQGDSATGGVALHAGLQKGDEADQRLQLFPLRGGDGPERGEKIVNKEGPIRHGGESHGAAREDPLISPGRTFDLSVGGS